MKCGCVAYISRKLEAEGKDSKGRKVLSATAKVSFVTFEKDGSRHLSSAPQIEFKLKIDGLKNDVSHSVVGGFCPFCGCNLSGDTKHYKDFDHNEDGSIMREDETPEQAKDHANKKLAGALNDLIKNVDDGT